MVTQERNNKRKLLTITEAQRIISESKTKAEMVDKLYKLPKRQPALPPPQGGISIREASRTHDIPDRTIGRWVNQGLIPTLRKTKNAIFIDGEYFADLVHKYKTRNGRISMKRIVEQAS